MQSPVIGGDSGAAYKFSCLNFKISHNFNPIISPKSGLTDFTLMPDDFTHQRETP